MSKCPFCGHGNPAGVELCKGCGARVPEVAAEPISPPPPSDAAGPEPQPDEFESRVLEELRQGRKIGAIKIYREATGQGLKDSKEAVEALAARHNIVARGGGCAGVLLLVLALLAVLAAVS